jgi:hypothetical protein
MSKTIARGIFYGVAAVLFLWTASLTYQFVAEALPGRHWAIPLLSLVVVDIGCLAWLVVFLDYAEGVGQRAIALSMCLFDLLGIALMSGAELFLGGQTLAAIPAYLGELAIYGLAIWTVSNTAAVVAFHLLSPTARSKMALQAERDHIIAESLERLKGKRAAVSGRVSDAMADQMMAGLLADLAADSDQGQKVKTVKPAPIAEPVKFSVNADGEPVPTISPRGE